jgi:hypothetical protein
MEWQATLIQIIVVIMYVTMISIALYCVYPFYYYLMEDMIIKRRQVLKCKQNLSKIKNDEEY